MSDIEIQAYIDFMSEQYPEIKDGTLDIELIGERLVKITLTNEAVPFQSKRHWFRRCFVDCLEEAFCM